MGKVEQIRQILLDPFSKVLTLSDFERQVLRLASRGKTNREIAEYFNITDERVAYYMRNALAKLGVKKSDLPSIVLDNIERIIG